MDTYRDHGDRMHGKRPEQSRLNSNKKRNDEELRCVVCVKNVDDAKKFEEFEDCFILEFGPSNESPNLENSSVPDNSQVVNDGDVVILDQKGPVACRDYSHPRHLCGTNSFENTPHESHCKMCFCYVCDVPAPCKNWTNVSEERLLNHCDASDDQFWRTKRRIAKNRVEASQRTPP
ncbi:hypothetical protein vseg_012388 [Gypsophila vaccaria]